MRSWAELGILADTVQFVSVWRLIWRGRQNSYPKILRIKILPTTINLYSNSNITTPIITPIIPPIILPIIPPIIPPTLMVDG